MEKRLSSPIEILFDAEEVSAQLQSETDKVYSIELDQDGSDKLMIDQTSTTSGSSDLGETIGANTCSYASNHSIIVLKCSHASISSTSIASDRGQCVVNQPENVLFFGPH
jgi:hypothetical protein